MGEIAVFVMHLPHRAQQTVTADVVSGDTEPTVVGAPDKGHVPLEEMVVEIEATPPSRLPLHAPLVSIGVPGPMQPTLVGNHEAAARVQVASVAVPQAQLPVAHDRLSKALV
jgi:hypothetical protein